MKIAVLTSLFGSKTDLASIRTKHDDVDYLAFVDRKHETTEGWQQINCIKFSDDDHYPHRRNAKPYKIIPHLFAPDYDYYVWMDAIHDLTVHPKELIDDYLIDEDMSVFSHPYRQCAFTEAEVCATSHIEHISNIKNQLKHYSNVGFPRNYGLYEMSCFILRNNDVTRKMGMMWWEQICRFSSRDQISFPYILWRMRKELDISILPGYVHYHADGNKIFPYLDLEKKSLMYDFEKKY